MALILSHTVLLSALITPVLITAAVRLMRLMRIMVNMAVVVVVSLALVWGLAQYQQAAAMPDMVRQIAAHLNLTAGRVAGRLAEAADQLVAQAHAVLIRSGLDPTALRVTVQCVHGQTILILTETRLRSLPGSWDMSGVQVPLSPAIRCRGAS